MAGKVQITAVEKALLDLLPRRLKVSYGQNVDVQTLGGTDFDDNGQLVLKSPAVRLHFNSAAYGDARDNTKTTQGVDLLFSAFCRHESLRSLAKFRSQTLELVGALSDELAGARLLLEDGSRTEAIGLTGVNQALDVAGPVDQVYALSFTVSGIATFSGINRDPEVH